MAKRITLKTLYTYYTIEEWDDEDGFSYIPTDEMVNGIEDRVDDKMINEFEIGYERGMTKRSCMWAEEVKRRAKWVRGETIYGFTREKHCTYQISWVKDKKEIGFYTYVIEADGYLSLNFFNGYTNKETSDTKWRNYIRPSCLYNNKVCNLLEKDNI
jgi:hypothetical protein